MVQRLVSVGDDFTLPAAVVVADANLPAASKAAAVALKLDASQKGAASGVAPLGADAKVPYANLPVDDTGWITTGLTVTPGTNWTLTSYSIRKTGNQAWARVILTYTGPDVATGADGNLGDLQAATIPAGYRPIYSWPLSVSQFATRTWGGFISTVGVLTLSNGLSTQTLTTGNSISFVGTYMTN